jgi:hypothetical protein
MSGAGVQMQGRRASTALIRLFLLDDKKEPPNALRITIMSIIVRAILHAPMAQYRFNSQGIHFLPSLWRVGTGS